MINSTVPRYLSLQHNIQGLYWDHAVNEIKHGFSISAVHNPLTKYSMVPPPIWLIIHPLKLMDYLSVQADKPYSITWTTGPWSITIPRYHLDLL